jgi:hypothetical protein
MTSNLESMLRDLPVPEAGVGLRERIIAARAAGGRVGLPVTDSASRRYTLRFTGLIAAAAALVALLFARRAERGDAAGGVAEFLAGVPLWPRTAFAQSVRDTTARAKYPLLGRVTGRFGRGRWVYDARLIVDGIDTTSQGTRTLTTAPGREPGTLVFTTDQTHRYARPMGDSLVVDEATLRILRRTFYYQSKSNTHDFTHDTIPHFVTWRNVDVGWHGTLYRALLQATPLSEGWRGSVYLHRGIGRDRWVVSPLDLRVTGQETVTTPAGRFPCWIVEAGFGGRRVLVWVSQSPQWVVKLDQLQGKDAVWQQVLVSPTPPAP